MGVAMRTGRRPGAVVLRAAGRALGIGLAAVLLVGLAACLGGTAAAEQGVPGMGPLGDRLPLGPEGDGGWRGAVEDGAYVLTHEGGGEAVRVVSIAPPGGGEAGITVEVQVAAEPGGGAAQAAAGLAYGVDPARSRYFAVVVQPDRTLVVYRHDAGGLHRHIVVGGGPLRSGANTLRVIGGPQGFTVCANDRQVAAYQGEGAGSGAGEVGIVAMGSGRFTFRGFRIEAAPETIPISAPAPPAARPQTRAAVQSWSVSSSASASSSSGGSAPGRRC